MVLKTEYEETQNTVLIVDKHPHTFIKYLKDELKKYDNEVFISPRVPPDLGKFQTFFLINSLPQLEKFITHTGRRVIFITIKKKREAHAQSELVRKLKLTHIKIINIDHSHTLTHEEMEKILWFSFSRTNEIFFEIPSRKSQTPEQVSTTHIHTPRFSLSILKKPRAIFLTLLFFLLTLHVLFIPPLLLASLFHYQAAQLLTHKNSDGALQKNNQAASFLQTSKQLYSLARPTFLLFGVVVYPDNIFELNDSAHRALVTGIKLYAEGTEIASLLLRKDKTPEETEKLSANLAAVKTDLSTLEDAATVIYQKLPTITPGLTSLKTNLRNKILLMTTIQKLIPTLDSVMAKGGEKKYLLLFANNMELRPGGGFIGSFGLVTMKNYTMSLQVYDVYDADGQLTLHVDPPKPIAQYLNQPHWFLRDSSFSPDFYENYRKAQYFLEKEMHIEHLDGAMVITTTAIQNILGGIGNLYIPDYKEVVNKDNFYLKAQLYAEKGFFPGSTQKKRFLAAVMDQLMISLESAPLPAFLDGVKKSLDEKQIAAYFEDQKVQGVIDSLYWSGRIIKPTCASLPDNCIFDYVLPVDANLGVNKANFFVSRSMSFESRISAEGSVNDTFTITFKNDSPNDVFPGGTYKNYEQILIPKDAVVKSVTKNDTLIDNVDETTDIYKTVGFFIEIKPHTAATIKLQYHLPTTLKTGQGVYQLVIQKQIGSFNSDFHFSVTMPPSIHAVNQNFSALVKSGAINYNTTLSADKLFFIDLVKE